MIRRLLAGGLAALLALLALAPPAVAQKRIALTFDDVPRRPGAWFTPDERTRRLIVALRRARVPQAAFFVVPGQIDKAGGTGGIERIAAYVSAGHVIGNHSFSHRGLSDLSPADYLADVDRAGEWLAGRAGLRPWFRYPFLNEGRADRTKRNAVRAGLAARGLRDAYVTIDGLDWWFEQRVTDAKAAGRKIDRAALRNLYVETQLGAAEYFDTLARAATGRSPAHVILLHETDINALFVGDLVRALRRHGWTIVTPDEAYRDPIAAAASRYDTPSAQGTLTEMVAWEKGLPAPRWYARNDEAVLSALFDRRVMKERAR